MKGKVPTRVAVHVWLPLQPHQQSASALLISLQEEAAQVGAVVLVREALCLN